MKQTILAALIFLIIIPACRRSNAPDSGINGSWKLIEVYDKSTATTSYRPAGSNKDVIITFENGNNFVGHTLVNDFSDGTFMHDRDQITFGSFSMTKVAEDQWGGSFLTVLNACLLQSVNPCSPSEITIQGNKMKIRSALKYDITLEKF